MEEALSSSGCVFSCFAGSLKGSWSELETTVNFINGKLRCVGDFKTKNKIN